MRSDWNFDTVKSMSALGTYSGTVNDLLYSAMVSEDDEPLDDGELNGSIDSEVETNGSDPIIGIGMNLGTAHSTVIITTPRSPGPVNTTDETLSGAALYLTSCRTLLNFNLVSGSVHSTCAPYATLTSVDGAGIVLTPADHGIGVGTIRPVKEVIPVGSLRLSSGPTSPIAPRRALNETARVGGLMVDEVILPILNNVYFPHYAFFRKHFSPHIWI
jgi:serine/threonine-protein kinase 24/25/MST4